VETAPTTATAITVTTARFNIASLSFPKFEVKPAIPPAEIKEKIAAALERSALFGGGRIVVEAADGKVTLSGHVSSMIEREEADRIARAAPGAARVDNRLIVTP
jgi:osmotically-inducible protein OsmY